MEFGNPRPSAAPLMCFLSLSTRSELVNGTLSYSLCTSACGWLTFDNSKDTDTFPAFPYDLDGLRHDMVTFGTHRSRIRT